jgi:hypothetical protein
MPCAPSRAQGSAVQKIIPWGFADIPAAAIEQAGQTGWPEVAVDEMEASEAASVMGRGLMFDEIEREALEHLADRLGCWPLLLDRANARLLEENKSRPGKPAECIARVTMLFERKGVLGFDRRDSTSRNAAVARSVDVGLDRAGVSAATIACVGSVVVACDRRGHMHFLRLAGR